jgi:amino acid transporter
MNDVVLVSIRDSDLLSILLYTAIYITVISTGGLSDFIIRKKYLKRVNARKVFHSIGALATAICLLIISFLDSRHRNLVVSLYIIGIVFRYDMINELCF